jgi:hypothetical protein
VICFAEAPPRIWAVVDSDGTLRGTAQDELDARLAAEVTPGVQVVEYELAVAARDLRALEWILEQGWEAERVSSGCVAVTAPARQVRHVTWAGAAKALGWPD